MIMVNRNLVCVFKLMNMKHTTVYLKGGNLMITITVKKYTAYFNFDMKDINDILIYYLLIIKTVDFLSKPQNKIYHFYKYVYDIHNVPETHVVRKYLRQDFENESIVLQNKAFHDLFITTQDYIQSLKVRFPKDITFSYIAEYNDLYSFTDIIPLSNEIYYPFLPLLLETIEQFDKKKDFYIKKIHVIEKLLYRKLQKFYTKILDVDFDCYKYALYNRTICEFLTKCTRWTQNEENLNKNYDKIEELKKTYNITNVYNVMTVITYDNLSYFDYTWLTSFLILKFFVNNNINIQNSIEDIYKQHAYKYSVILFNKKDIYKNINFYNKYDFKPVKEILNTFKENLTTMYERAFSFNYNENISDYYIYYIHQIFFSMDTLSFLYTVYNRDTLDYTRKLHKSININELLSLMFLFLDKYTTDNFIENNTKQMVSNILDMLRYNYKSVNVLVDYIPSIFFDIYEDNFVNFLKSRKKYNYYIPLFKRMSKFNEKILSNEALVKYKTFII